MLNNINMIILQDRLLTHLGKEKNQSYDLNQNNSINSILLEISQKTKLPSSMLAIAINIKSNYCNITENTANINNNLYKKIKIGINSVLINKRKIQDLIAECSVCGFHPILIDLQCQCELRAQRHLFAQKRSIYEKIGWQEPDNKVMTLSSEGYYLQPSANQFNCHYYDLNDIKNIPNNSTHSNLHPVATHHFALTYLGLKLGAIKQICN